MENSIIGTVLVLVVWSLWKNLPLALVGGATWYWLASRRGSRDQR